MSPDEPTAKLLYNSICRQYELSVQFGEDTGRLLMDRYARVIVDRVVSRIVEDLLSSAAITARVALIRTELPARIERAIADAISAAVLAPLKEAEHDE